MQPHGTLVTRLKAAAAGAALAVAAAAVLHQPWIAGGRLLLGLFLALTACVYLGALLAQQQGPGTTLGELAVALAVFVCAYLGVAGAAVWLAAGYALHGVWDWFHDIEAVPTRVSRWFPPACAAFDFVVAGFILLFLG